MAGWYKGMQTQMRRSIFQRELYGSESMDKSNNEIYMCHIKEMCRQLARANTPEAAVRKFGIKLLWRCAGRAGEPALLAYGGLKWDALFGTVVIEAPQSKSSKLKFVPLVAGHCRHTDLLLDFGDHLILEHGKTVYSSDEKIWLLAELSGDNAGTKLANFIKGMQPAGRTGSLAKYAKHFAVPSLPPKPSCNGVRHGASETLATAVPAELAVHTTGHDLSGLSALWEYLDTHIALTIPGAIALAEWPSLPYGHLGKGPVHPSLQPLIDSKKVTLEFVEAYIDELFSFHDASPPMLLVDGPCHPMMHATLATLIMYYEVRFRENEMTIVLQHMRDAYIKISVSSADVHGTFVVWGEIIKSQFDSDNAHLTARLDHEGIQQLVSLAEQQQKANVRLLAQIAEMNARLERIELASGSASAAECAEVSAALGPRHSAHVSSAHVSSQLSSSPSSSSSSSPSPSHLTLDC